MWQDIGLDGLCLVSYMPGFSGFNMIEHAWVPLTNAPTGVTLPNTLEGEVKLTAEQSNLSPEEVNQKENKVFHHALIYLMGSGEKENIMDSQSQQ